MFWWRVQLRLEFTFLDPVGLAVSIVSIIVFSRCHDTLTSTGCFPYLCAGFISVDKLQLSKKRVIIDSIRLCWWEEEGTTLMKCCSILVLWSVGVHMSSYHNFLKPKQCTDALLLVVHSDWWSRWRYPYHILKYVLRCPLLIYEISDTSKSLSVT